MPPPAGQRLRIKTLDAQFIRQEPATKRADGQMHLNARSGQQFDDALRVSCATGAGNADDDGERWNHRKQQLHRDKSIKPAGTQCPARRLLLGGLLQTKTAQAAYSWRIRRKSAAIETACPILLPGSCCSLRFMPSCALQQG